MSDEEGSLKVFRMAFSAAGAPFVRMTSSGMGMVGVEMVRNEAFLLRIDRVWNIEGWDWKCRGWVEGID